MGAYKYIARTEQNTVRQYVVRKSTEKQTRYSSGLLTKSKREKLKGIMISVVKTNICQYILYNHCTVMWFLVFSYLLLSFPVSIRSLQGLNV